ncbi:glycoside hydrolase family 30 beta sandwich domain-containing protein [Luteibacter sp. SG786]|uniref:glycoside hydrolase family 30 protein n=1 Tax=Luteibacter sp. SG786 TaxID=2587130 RepID=UPI001420FB0B|nr:glycoside hydrolase family 30 beta sandwich domain-containing protein [Luteibacter sp. SG786]NII55431.1 glucosylceramidase [Luteibacter sp. SG786]
MDDLERSSERVAAVFVALMSLLTLAALSAPRYEEERLAAAQAAEVAPIMPAVEVWLSTTGSKLRLAPQPSLTMTARGDAPVDIAVDVQARYQSVTGFGAAMTDASAWLIRNRLDEPHRQALLHELYGPPPNLNFNMMRLTIGASDFSLNLYTLDDIPFGESDQELRYFNVAANLHDLIPTVKDVLAVNPGLLIVASPWSAPAWMKDSQNLIGGELLSEYESAFADYLIKYVDTYRSHGIPIFALTLQNEPAYSPISYPGMIMGAATRARIIANYLGPRLAKRKQRTRILDWDHNWSHPEQPLAVLGDPAAAPYVDGVAWHCYEGSQHAQGRVHRAHPDKDAYITECSGGDWSLNMNGELLWSARNLLVTGMRQWARGVIYWNLALDENHGPHFGGCTLCNGVITIDSVSGEVTRTDEYYALAHFSRFVLPGAVRVRSTDTDADKGIANVAFQNVSDDSVVLVMVNIRKEARTVSVAQGQTRFDYTIPPESVATLTWNPNPVGVWMRRAIGWLGPSAARGRAE